MAPLPSLRRSIYAAAALLAIAGLAPVASFGADAQSLYQQAITMQSGAGTIDLKAAQNMFEKAASAGSALAMQRLGDMYHDGDGGVAKDYAKAIEWYQKEAALDDGHPGTGALGMVALSEMYDKGSGVPQDHIKAGDWFAKAFKSGQIGAAKGDNSAMIALAYCQATGHGDIKPDPVNAWQWAIKSSAMPNPWAFEIMASMYGGGIGVTRDDSKMLQNMLAAAQTGVSQDMLNVSLCFASGIGVKKDEAAAMEWIKKAVDRGNSRAMAVLGNYYHQGIGAQRSDMTAREWYQKAVDLGDESALGYMGDLLIAPGVSPRDSLTAATWYEKGAKVGDLSSMYQLANLLVYDDKVPHDLNRAQELLMQAQGQGHGDSMAMMGELYYKRIIPGTRSDALVWFKKAAAAGSPMGMRDLGEVETIIADGANAHVSTDDDVPLMTEAFGWLQRAAGAGDVVAMADVGDAYMNGDGPAVSVGTAITWYQKAVDLGNVRAIRSLGVVYKEDRLLTDYEKAQALLEKAMAMGDAQAISQLGDMYYRGLIKKDAEGHALQDADAKIKAYQLFRQAMEKDDGGGYRGLAEFLQDGQYLDANLQQAAAYYQKAVDRGDVPSMEALGRMFELGQGVKKDIKRATDLFTAARDAGSFSAANWVFSHTLMPGTATITSDTATTTGPSPGPSMGHLQGVANPPKLQPIAPPPSTEPETQPGK